MRVQLSGKRFVFGRQCYCCSGPADTELAVSASRTTGKRVIKTKTNTWMIPYCRACKTHVDAWNAAGGGGLIVLSVVSALILLSLHWILAVTVGIGGVSWALSSSSKKREAARAMCTSDCACPQESVSYQGWAGTVETFEITSEKLALQLIQANRNKLVNASPEMLDRLDSVRQSQLSPQFTVSVSTERVDDTVLLKWIQKVESAKGPAARRAAAELALKDSGLGSHRDDFVRAAAKVEMRATLDKVDALKTVQAKKRRLKDAVDALRNDSAPDHLQQAEIECLEEALQGLEAES